MVHETLLELAKPAGLGVHERCPGRPVGELCNGGRDEHGGRQNGSVTGLSKLPL
jgi:hypothetical protein